MKRIIIVFAIFSSLAFAYASKLDVDTDLGLYFSQGVYGKDWAGGELGNISWTGKFYGSAELQLFKWLAYKVVQNCSFGQTHAQYRDASGRLRWAHPEKNADRWDSEFIQKIIIIPDWVEPYTLMRAERVFVGEDDDGNPESPHIIQSVLTVGLSREMIISPDAKLNLRFGYTYRLKNEQTEVVVQYPDWFGGMIYRFDVTKWDNGAEMSAEYMQKFSKINAKLRSDLRLYQVIERYGLGWNVEGLQPIEVRWDNDFTIKVWKCVTANFNFALRYDIEEVDKLQWRQMLGIGIGYIHP
ncbi:MAG: hypothetical protein ACOYIS_06255 [Candidatus Cloacimonadaceae bacterium]|jgi:hypothetical protein